MERPATVNKIKKTIRHRGTVASGSTAVVWLDGSGGVGEDLQRAGDYGRMQARQAHPKKSPSPLLSASSSSSSLGR